MMIASSVYKLYSAFAESKISGFTIPAINLRTLTFDTASIIFRLAMKKNIGPFIFEIAPSEMEYTKQCPNDFSADILKAAEAENYQGPIFIQGDHFHVEKDIGKIKTLLKDSIEAGFYNIDIDASSLELTENYKITALLTRYIRSIQPKNITIAIGAEVNHIGGANTTIGEFEQFIEGYSSEIKTMNVLGISKISIQTGSSHGGTPLADGSLAQVHIDFDLIKKIGDLAKNKYHLAGVVQHGASTLPMECFDEFQKNNTLEIHLSTGLQNIVFDHLPSDLKEKMYQWISGNYHDEELTREQLIYKERKRSLGQFKDDILSLSKDEKQPILENLEAFLYNIFERLNIFNTDRLIKNYI